MGSEVAKTELEVLAQEKLDDAAALIAGSRWSSGYYLGGYAVELALKACIAKSFKAVTIPDKDLVNATYSHNFRNLVGTAGLSADLRNREQADRNFAALSTAWVEVPITQDVIDAAVSVLSRHRLRAADALQLAAAKVAAGKTLLAFVTLDEDLAEAAQSEGFPILP